MLSCFLIEKSILGLAHFVEHLGFKSTKSFASYELIKALESLGLAYGPDLNASTHLHETKYRLTNLSIDDEWKQLQLGLQILYEWAFQMNISETDVEEEKQVILAEYRAKMGLSQRLLDSYWPQIFGETSKISQRFPIGLPEIFMNVKFTELRKFYEKWYIPNNIAIIVTGDFESHIDLVESFILKQFNNNEFSNIS